MKEKLKVYLKAFEKNWVWFTIGAYVSSTIIFWCFYFLEFINLLIPILNTIIYPIGIGLAYYGRQPKYEKRITKIVLIGCFGYVLSVPVWLITAYLLIVAPWAPFHDLSTPLKNLLLPLLIIPSYGLTAYLMYRIGKNRNWEGPSTY
ncbi:MAG: hypothetical protein ACQERB_17395 [Promethearchaeati archaeon]